MVQKEQDLEGHNTADLAVLNLQTKKAWVREELWVLGIVKQINTINRRTIFKAMQAKQQRLNMRNLKITRPYILKSVPIDKKSFSGMV